MDGASKFNFQIDVLVPAERLLRAARERLTSPDEAVQSVAKALLDVTSEAEKIRNAFANANKEVSLAPYFDFWFGDAIGKAQALLSSDDPDVRNLAQCLIEQERDVIRSKESFLREQKRLGIRSSHP